MCRPTRTTNGSCRSTDPGRCREWGRPRGCTPSVPLRLPTQPRYATSRPRVRERKYIQKNGLDGVGDQPVIAQRSRGRRSDIYPIQLLNFMTLLDRAGVQDELFRLASLGLEESCSRLDVRVPAWETSSAKAKMMYGTTSRTEPRSESYAVTVSSDRSASPGEESRCTAF